MLILPAYVPKQRKEELEHKVEELERELIEKEPDLIYRVQQKADFLERAFQGPKDGRHVRICSALDKFFEGIEEEGSRHSQLMFSLTFDVAWKMGFNLEEAMKISCAAILHDIGKAVLPESLKEKMRAGNYYFDEEEYNAVKNHVLNGKMIAERIPTLTKIHPEVSSVILFHHERSDGRGYLLGLRGHNLELYEPELYKGEIPIESMIISVCDAYLAIARKRGYNEPDSPCNEGIQEITQELLRCSEDEFDDSCLRRNSDSKVDIWRRDWKNPTKDYERMIRERCARNMLFGELPRKGLSINYAEVFTAPIKQVEENYSTLRSQSEAQFYKAVVRTLAKTLTSHESKLTIQ